MDTNFVALVPRFKLERRPTFVVACDAGGVQWLRDRFLGLVDAEIDLSFVIGDGIAMASDDKCRLTVAKARDGELSEIQRSSQTSFTWRIGRKEAAEASEKLRSLEASNMPGHQYFELDNGRFRTVVITKDEYLADAIRAMRDGRAPAG